MKKYILPSLAFLCFSACINSNDINHYLAQKFNDVDSSLVHSIDSLEKSHNTDSLYSIITNAGLVTKKARLKSICDSATMLINLSMQEIDSISKHDGADMKASTKVMIDNGRAFQLKTILNSLNTFAEENFTKAQLSKMNFSALKSDTHDSTSELSLHWEHVFKSVPTFAAKTLLNAIELNNIKRNEMVMLLSWVDEQKR